MAVPHVDAGTAIFFFTTECRPPHTGLALISRLYVKSIIEKLNNRPRKKNGFRKPKDMIKEKIA